MYTLPCNSNSSTLIESAPSTPPPPAPVASEPDPSPPVLVPIGSDTSSSSSPRPPAPTPPVSNVISSAFQNRYNNSTPATPSGYHGSEDEFIPSSASVYQNSEDDTILPPEYRSRFNSPSPIYDPPIIGPPAIQSLPSENRVSAFSDTTASSPSSTRAQPLSTLKIPGPDSGLILAASNQPPAKSSPSRRSFMTRSLGPLEELLKSINDAVWKENNKPPLTLAAWEVIMGSGPAVRAKFRSVTNGPADPLIAQPSGSDIGDTSLIDILCSNMSDSNEESLWSTDMAWLRTVTGQASVTEASDATEWETAFAELLNEAYMATPSTGTCKGLESRVVRSGSYGLPGGYSGGAETGGGLHILPPSGQSGGSSGFGTADTDITAQWRWGVDGVLEEIVIELQPAV